MKKIKLYLSETQQEQVTHSEGLIGESVMKGLFTEVEAGLRELTMTGNAPMGYQQQVSVTTLRSVDCMFVSPKKVYVEILTPR